MYSKQLYDLCPGRLITKPVLDIMRGYSAEGETGKFEKL